MKITVYDDALPLVQSWVTEALTMFAEQEDYSLLQGTELILFSDLPSMQKFLSREVPSTMFMVPLCTREQAVIVALSLLAEPRNNDKLRFQRHFLHECCHITHRRKYTDGNIDDHGNLICTLPYWLDEGLAEIYSLTLTGQQSRMTAMIVRAAGLNIHDHELDYILCSLNHPDRQAAFDLCVARAAAALKRCQRRCEKRDIAEIVMFVWLELYNKGSPCCAKTIRKRMAETFPCTRCLPPQSAESCIRTAEVIS